jgi:hypothetical protein
MKLFKMQQVFVPAINGMRDQYYRTFVTSLTIPKRGSCSDREYLHKTPAPWQVPKNSGYNMPASKHRAEELNIWGTFFLAEKVIYIEWGVSGAGDIEHSKCQAKPKRIRKCIALCSAHFS